MNANILTLVLPFRGVITAGWPSPAEEELGDTLTFEEWLVPHKEASCLVTVATAAMRSEGILPDDIVIMERGRPPRHGSIVIAAVDGNTMIRRYELRGSVPRLVDGNGNVQTIDDSNDVRLLGVVASVIRKY